MSYKQLIQICFILILPIFVLAAGAKANEFEHNLGIGIGLPYGGWGLNYEFGATDYFAPTFGIGERRDTQWNVGFRLYYPGKSAKFRFRTTFLYGSNTIIKREYPNGRSEYEAREGASAGPGFNWRFGEKWGFDFDFFIVDSDIPDGYEEKSSGNIIALGFVRRF